MEGRIFVVILRVDTAVVAHFYQFRVIKLVYIQWLPSSFSIIRSMVDFTPKGVRIRRSTDLRRATTLVQGSVCSSTVV